MIISTFNFEPKEVSLKVWRMELEDLTDRDFIQAVLHVCRTQEKLPGPNLAAVIRNYVEIGQEKITEEAWGEVMKAVSGVGRYGKPQFSSEAIAETVDVLGWESLCNVRSQELNTMRAHFYRSYEAIRKRRQVRTATKILESAEVRELIGKVGLSIPQQTRMN